VDVLEAANIKKLGCVVSDVFGISTMAMIKALELVENYTCFRLTEKKGEELCMSFTFLKFYYISKTI